MSRPLYHGGLVGEIDEQGRAGIVDDGNWSLTEGGGPAWRSLAMYVNGTEAFGYRPSVQREPFDQARARPGVFLRGELLDWIGPVLAPGSKVEMILVGGSRYEGWGDTAGQNWMEWGSQNPADASQTIVATTGVLTVAGDTGTPPPKPPPGQWTVVTNEQAMVETGYELVEQWRANGVSDPKIADTMHYQALRALLERDAKKRAAVKAAIRKVLG